MRSTDQSALSKMEPLSAHSLNQRPIVVPRSALRFILLQRTQFQSRILRLVGRPYHPVGMAIDTFVRRREIARLYDGSLRRDLDEIAPHLPQSLASVLDIGCGVAGIDALLARRYPNARFHLLDKTAVEKPMYGYQSRGEIYNSLEAAKELMLANSVAAERITISDAGDTFPSGKFDLVISLISWCFHYPSSTYINDVKRVAHRIIVDVRKGTPARKELESIFGTSQVISETATKERLLLQAF